MDATNDDSGPGCPDRGHRLEACSANPFGCPHSPDGPRAHPGPGKDITRTSDYGADERNPKVAQLQREYPLAEPGTLTF